ncbi:MAG: fatty acid cis/trans isomerase [Deltaproteobacteria bacterium]|nr:fatty acid cis/trans isomerase [Deltaproteobacteria bacterium]
MSRTQASLGLLVAALLCLGMTCAQPPPVELATLPGATGSEPISYLEQVKPVLDNRCVVCHGCYDAPCQLLFSSHEGLDRGATKQIVYQSSRFRTAPLTRLHVDAQNTDEWRELGFFSVLEEPDSAGYGSLLLNMLALGRTQSVTPDARLPDSFPLDINRELSCPTAAEFEGYARKHPTGGMPYGTAPLTDRELGVLAAWVQQGAVPPPAPPPLPKSAIEQVEHWEKFLNGSSLKERITSRYLFEHWIFAHLYFEDLPSGPFFQIARSSTPPGTPAERIATRRPYDDPGVEDFWYRLVPYESTIVHKTHIVYPLGETRMRRLSELFLASDWEPTRLPEYDANEGSNPFASFAEIPARSRYQFLLDDAQYFVMTFIRGPVCRGQVAVSVIQDHFFVAFLDPDVDLSVVNKAFFKETTDLLSLPGGNESDFKVGRLWLKYNLAQRRYLAIRKKFYNLNDPDELGPSLDFLWDGDGHNRNAQLTVFRHFDNATVVKGFVGEIPKTAWVIDFPIFERIYYDLVANFDVFGNVGHQLSTRLYMDHLRMQSENIFLAFLPADQRQEIRASWYVDAERDRSYRVNKIITMDHATQIPFETRDVKKELIEMILAHDPAIAGPPDLLNRCGDPPCDSPKATPIEKRAQRALQRITGITGTWVAELPEMAFLRIRSGGNTTRDASYTLVHNRAHTNVAAMFEEDKRLIPEQDTLTIVRGYLGSYPNLLFDVDVDQIDSFTQTLTSVENAADFEKLVDRWGIRRTSPRFWSTVDWIHQDARQRTPTEVGLFDFGRYKNL